ncbi:hypothetical protein Hanom_Chr07g00668421 [Helianthus anomalus]
MYLLLLNLYPDDDSPMMLLVCMVYILWPLERRMRQFAVSSSSVVVLPAGKSEDDDGEGWKAVEDVEERVRILVGLWRLVRLRLMMVVVGSFGPSLLSPPEVVVVVVVGSMGGSKKMEE